MSDKTKLKYLIDHVFLPPKLPQDDDSSKSSDAYLLSELLGALEAFTEEHQGPAIAKWRRTVKAIGRLVSLRDPDGHLSAEKIETEMRHLANSDSLPLHIVQQNACIIVRRTDTQFIFESSELSPSNSSVMQTIGRLERHFPGPAIAVDQEIVLDNSFTTPLIEMIAFLDNTPIQCALPSTTKAGSRVTETRDTTSPLLISEYLNGVLGAIGFPVNRKRIIKYCRDDVLWDNVKIPWSRSSLWLLIRVTLQTSLAYEEVDQTFDNYKSFMIFFLTRIVKKALINQMPHDLLFVMIKKISRRAMKSWSNLPEKLLPAWVLEARGRVQEVHNAITKSWKGLQAQMDPQSIHKYWHPLQFDLENDLMIQLPDLKSYLVERSSQGSLSTTVHTLSPLRCKQRIRQDHLNLPDLNSAAKVEGEELQLRLADFELWIEQCLDLWVLNNVQGPDTCSQLACLSESYKNVSARAYKDQPLFLSIMILTQLEIWIAVDRLAGKSIPLLLEYGPDIPLGLLAQLLLPHKTHMERLARIEAHLDGRYRAARSDRPSVLESMDETNSFPVKFFDQTPEMQDLRSKIRTDANTTRTRKIEELRQKNAQYDTLSTQARQLQHDLEFCIDKNGRACTRCERSCIKCALTRQAEQMTIDVHEWPLPLQFEASKAVVFMLRKPRIFAIWRDMTYSMLRDVLSPCAPDNKSPPVWTLWEYANLRRYHTPANPDRVQLASMTKPFVVSHYKSKPVSNACESDICVNHGLQYALYDVTQTRFISGLALALNIRSMCSLQLPEGPFKALQHTLDGTKHSSNEAIASQGNCPSELTLHEYHAFFTLRSGHRLQWRNIARQLRSREMNFNREETFLLVIQTAFQACPRDLFNIYRESHMDLGERDFGVDLASALDTSVRSLERNWQASIAIRAFSILSSRLLSLTQTDSVRNTCLDILRTARRSAIEWTRALHARVPEICGDDLARIKSQILEMALSSFLTFDVERCHIPRILNSDEDVEHLVECLIMVNDHVPAVLSALPPSIKDLLLRRARVAFRVEEHLRHLLFRRPKGFDHAIFNLWPGFKASSVWSCMNSPDERWATTQTCGEDECRTMTVHLNLLTGLLLVDSVPLTRLPRNYEMHPNYVRLFDQKVLDVIPSTMPDMIFECRGQISGFEIHFAMREAELIIRAKSAKEVWELVPARLLEGAFPDALVKDYAHWLDTSTSIVIWQPLKDPWPTSSSNWNLQQCEKDDFQLMQHSLRAISCRSDMVKSISWLLSPLEKPCHIHVCFDQSRGTYEIHLPRFGLDFFMVQTDDKLQSKQYRGFAIDTNQSFGSLTGLASKLVLLKESTQSRVVLIPHGAVEFSSEAEHVRSRIETPLVGQVSHHQFRIDPLIGRLVDNGSLKSRLFLCYLHAITASSLPDDLTGRTGTDEALASFTAASTQSITDLEADHLELLYSIARLTPRREWYPTNLNIMQRVAWANLLPIAQHHRFYTLVKTFIENSLVYASLQGNSQRVPASFDQADDHLIRRSAIRNAYLYVEGFGAEDFGRDQDKVYQPRDRTPNSERQTTVFQIASLAREGSKHLKFTPSLLSIIEGWKKVVTNTSSPFSLACTKDWFENPIPMLCKNWCSFQRALSKCEPVKDKYTIVFFLSAIVYSGMIDKSLAIALLALATVPELRKIEPPNHAQFDLKSGYFPVRTELEEIVRSHVYQYEACPESRRPALPHESPSDTKIRLMQEFCAASSAQIEFILDNLMNQGPCETLIVPQGPYLTTYVDVNRATAEVKELFRMWYRNTTFKVYINQLQDILTNLQCPTLSANRLSFEGQNIYIAPHTHYISFIAMTQKAKCTLLVLEMPEFAQCLTSRSTYEIDKSRLQALLDPLMKSATRGYEKKYLHELSESVKSLESQQSSSLKHSIESLVDLLKAHNKNCTKSMERIYKNALGALLRRSSIGESFARVVHDHPRTSPVSLLQHIVGRNALGEENNFRDVLINYALSIASLQQSNRLLENTKDASALASEMLSAGKKTWDVTKYPEWLVFEIENNITIRAEQAQVAQIMISPPRNKNTTLQLNMGEGKTSVIVPIVATTLANGLKLTRIVVLKPLSAQMFQLLLSKLGGLLDRRVFFLPISRDLRPTETQVAQIRRIYELCMETQGILLVQPEHLLSFELMGIERMASGDRAVGSALIETQKWLNRHSRDVLDESDEILDHKFEVVYTMGLQQPLEFGPNRWTIIQNTLQLASRFAKQAFVSFPHGIQLQARNPGSFPLLRVLTDEAGDDLIRSIAKNICENGMPGVSLWTFSRTERALVYKFMTESQFSKEEYETLEEYALQDQDETLKDSLMLLRGLLACGVLPFCLKQKRWRVDFGLDLQRTMFAVPYTGKDTPANRAEYSHPDVAIVLTCLSYYYGSLTTENLQQCFERLLKSDDAEEQYHTWAFATTLTPDLKELQGVNLSDDVLCRNVLFPKLRDSKKVIDYYLSMFVFPKEARQFPQKLSASGWNLAREKIHPTTGFSGTNDSRYIMPLTIEQKSLVAQQHTNATALARIIADGNSFYTIASTASELAGAQSLLQIASRKENECRVIIDVGAQVLELRNEEMARNWLELTPVNKAKAAIFFDENNNIVVIDRMGVIELLSTSHFLGQMDECLIFLDEVHTRGTDLKIPSGYRALLTLGPRLVKDRLAQAAMRMRKLGHGHTITICGTLEMQQQILVSVGKEFTLPIFVEDVLFWCIRNTWVHTIRAIALWMNQGLRNQKCTMVENAIANCTDNNALESLAESLLEDEAKSICQRYLSRDESTVVERLGKVDESVRRDRAPQLRAILARCNDFSVDSCGEAELQEEQERELSPEMECERQVERPPHATPAVHQLHMDVVSFVKTGIINTTSHAFSPAFESLNQTTFHKSFESNTWSRQLLVTADFACTVEASAGQMQDSFLRPVQWITTTRSGSTTELLVIISPFEANELVQDIRRYKKCSLHLYAPRTHVSSQSFDDLSFGVIPPANVLPRPIQREVSLQLGLFAGQLYFENHDSYVNLTRFLGLCYSAPSGAIKVGNDGFVQHKFRASYDVLMLQVCPFNRSPIMYLRSLVLARRKGNIVSHTHIGQILDNILMMAEDFA